MSTTMAATETEAEYLVRQAAASLSFEGMILTEDEKEKLKQVALGEIPYEKYLKQLKEG